ncbi:MAG: hypothetical protein EXQ95_15050 [Alphaproteobacteria bacterium]|nr:hypothetical protein [Alphaproteobacteria bacterium]
MSQRQEEAFASAGVHLRAGRLDRAAGILLQILTHAPADPMLWCVLAWIFEAMAKDGEAVACYRRALERDPAFSLAVRGLDDLRSRHVDLGRAAEAATRYGEAALFGAEGEANDGLARLSLQRLRGDLPAPHRSEGRWLRFYASRDRLGRAVELLQSGDPAHALRLFRQLESATTEPESIYARPAAQAAAAAASMIPPPAPALPSAAAVLAEIDRLSAEGRVEEAAVAARRAVEATADPRAVQDRWQSLRARLLDPPDRLVLPDLGAVSVAREGSICRLRLLDRQPLGRVLSFHYPAMALLDPEDPMLSVHSHWEAREVARVLLGLGYDLDIAPMDGSQAPKGEKPFDAAFSLHGAFARHLDLLSPSAKRLLLLTGSAPDYQNRREAERISALAARRPGPYQAKRVMGEADEARALGLADHVILIGNGNTLGTYDARWHPKMSLIAATGSLLLGRRDPATRPAGDREFLWHGGNGAVLKGLDRALEAVARRPDWVLNVIGFPHAESDFDALYETELYRTPSIRLHGAMPTDTRRFQAATSRCFAFVSPAASEGMSTAAVTCLDLGLYPIVSRDVGLDLPDGCGIVLDTCEVEEVERAMAMALALPPAELARQTLACQRYAAETFSREGYSRRLRGYLAAWLG